MQSKLELQENVDAELSVWNQSSLWLLNGSILHSNCFMTGIDGILQSLRITVMQRHIPAEAGAVSSPPFCSPTLALSLSAVLRSLVLLHFSCNTHPDLSLCLRSVSSLGIVCTSLLLASVVCVSDCVCVNVCVCVCVCAGPHGTNRAHLIFI